MIFKYKINVRCLSNHRDSKFTRWLAHSPLLFTCQNFYRQKLVTNAHLEMGHYWKCHISRWNMVSQAWHAVTNPRLVARTFRLDIGIAKAVSMWRCCECEANSSKKFDKTANLTPILNLWPIGVHFRWPCLSDFLCMVGGSSDLCRLCQLLWDSAEQTALSSKMQPDGGKWFPLVYMSLLVHRNRKRVI